MIKEKNVRMRYGSWAMSLSVPFGGLLCKPYFL